MSSALEGCSVLAMDDQLKDFLYLHPSDDIEDLLAQVLVNPLRHLLAHPGKNFRSDLVEFSFSVAQSAGGPQAAVDEQVIRGMQSVLESLHVGSLIIDDIQDGSEERRGVPAVHVAYGVPIALNAGNWLYFRAFQIIQSMGLTEERRCALTREMQAVLLRAHYGQALDIGLRFDTIPRGRLSEVSRVITGLKTGVLCGFASQVGALACGAEIRATLALEKFGREFGVALQMYDDIGNVLSEKRWRKWAEDVRLKRVTCAVSIAGEVLRDAQFDEFIALAANGNFGGARDHFVASGAAEVAQGRAGQLLETAIRGLHGDVGLSAGQMEWIRGLQMKLMRAYG